MNNEKPKGRLLQTITTFSKDREGNDRYINILARIETADGSRSYLVPERNLTLEQWTEAGRRLLAKESIMYENDFRGKKGGEGNTEGADEKAPF